MEPPVLGKGHTYKDFAVKATLLLELFTSFAERILPFLYPFSNSDYKWRGFDYIVASNPTTNTQKRTKK